MINGVTATSNLTNWIIDNGGSPCNPVNPPKVNSIGETEVILRPGPTLWGFESPPSS